MFDLELMNRVALLYPEGSVEGVKTKAIVWDVERRKVCYTIPFREDMYLVKLFRPHLNKKRSLVLCLNNENKYVHLYTQNLKQCLKIFSLNLFIQTKNFSSQCFYDKSLKKHVLAIGFYGEGIFFYDMISFKVLGRLKSGYASSTNFKVIFGGRENKLLVATRDGIIKFYG